MSSIRLPDFIDLRLMPELGALTLLDAALAIAIADQTLRREHADIYRCLDRQSPRSTEAVLAWLLVRSIRDLRHLLELYADAVRLSPRVATDDIPF